MVEHILLLMLTKTDQDSIKYVRGIKSCLNQSGLKDNKFVRSNPQWVKFYTHPKEKIATKFLIKTTLYTAQMDIHTDELLTNRPTPSTKTKALKKKENHCHHCL